MSGRTNKRHNHIFGHRMLLVGILCLFGFCAAVGALSPMGQSPATGEKKPMKVTLLHADRTVQRQSNKNLQMLIGNVEFLYDSIYMSCDTAYNYNNRNYFEAFGNVRMNQGDTLFLYGDYLDYDGDTRLVRVRHNVRMENRSVVLLTDSLNYDRDRNLGYYFEGGTLEDSANVLTSEWGQYSPQTKIATFNYNVTLTNPQFQLTSDTLRYSTATRVANIVGPSDIESGDSYIYSELGYYNTAARKAYLLNRSVLTNQSKVLVGDSVFYDETLKFGEAFGAVEMDDTLNRVMLLQ